MNAGNQMLVDTAFMGVFFCLWKAEKDRGQRIFLAAIFGINVASFILSTIRLLQE